VTPGISPQALQRMRSAVETGLVYHGREDWRREALAALEQWIVEAKARPVYLLRVDMDGLWTIGPVDAPHFHRPRRMDGLRVARDVIAARGCVVKLDRSVRATRALLKRAVRWLEKRAQCHPLADAVRNVKVTTAGAYFEDEGNTVIDT
jgi:hypothetical protein